MKLSIILLAASASAEDGSSILKGALQSLSKYSPTSDAHAKPNLRAGASGQYCDFDSQCSSNKFCKKPDGNCFYGVSSEAEGVAASLETSPPVEGRCRRRPQYSACVEGDDPYVCGCDGNTYNCREDAYLNGVNVDYAGPCAPPLRKTYRLVNSGSPAKRAIAVESCTPGTSAVLHSQIPPGAPGAEGQTWYWNEDGTFESVMCPGMVLNVDGGVGSGCADETNIILWEKKGVEWERWYYSPPGAGSRIFSKYCDGKVLDYYMGLDQDETNIQLFHDNGSDSYNQKWAIEEQ